MQTISTDKFVTLKNTSDIMNISLISHPINDVKRCIKMPLGHINPKAKEIKVYLASKTMEEATCIIK